MAVEHSRGLRLGAEVTGRSERDLEVALEGSRVVVSGDPDMPMAVLTLRVLLTTLRRGPGTLVLERGELASRDVEALAASVDGIDPERRLQIVRTAAGEPTARLHVGPTHGSAIRLVPEGFGAHVAGQRSAAIRPVRAGNPLGAVYTASLGSAEAFKWITRVLPSRRVLHRHLRFCPLTLSSDLAVAPDLPHDLVFELALIGIGAIGTGVVLLLDELGASGRLLAVDLQRFGKENRGTYSLGTQADVMAAPWKVELAKAGLPLFDVIPFCRPIEELPEAIDSGTAPWFPTVMTALDSPEGRRAAQRLWPDRLIDAGTGDTVLAIRDYEHGGRCMICVFPPNREGPSGAERLAEATGLSVSRAMRGDDPLTEEDLDGLAAEQRAGLEPYLGKPVCGLAQPFGLTSLDPGDYQPSIPFISLQAACLAVARLVAQSVDYHTGSNLVQYDGLVGPQRATIDQMRRVPGCTCQTRASVIELVRARRRHASNLRSNTDP